jgi:ABC-type transport system involved in cytochrome c biogenesis permease subunit
VPATYLVQLATLVLSVLALIILVMVLRKIKRDFFVISMVVLFIFLLIGRITFLAMYFTDIVDGTLFDNIFYNWFNSFLSFFTSFSILYTGISACIRLNKKYE